ncbi:AcrR family transcriptional regulator [Weissella uvarum]|uniref:TetR/AcrR family transcriptional regulator n=1 Tax=Weissella uvarum TaxID=1479233 RepID=UPI00195FDEDB|nr:TetR/AcrR family transcriptional regulator [Weissella uvarum]MBM7616925.1 AcrR family transcriptional regulator [Weissella uvarum]MCM0594624.1 TetR/AcrR family transcriptional regulator [Weissella uvarum]
MVKVNEAQIFAAAREVLNEEGYDKARLADVARKLDITSAALYKHFKNKEDLFDETLQDWIDKVDQPIFDANERAKPDEREDRLHDWLWLLASQRQQHFIDEPELTKLFAERLRANHELLNQRLVSFSEIVENIMAWDTFRHQRGVTVMQTFVMFYHPYFVNAWQDPLLKTLFESTWLEIKPIVSQSDAKND